MQNLSEKFLVTSETAGGRSELNANATKGLRKNVIAMKQASSKRHIEIKSIRLRGVVLIRHKQLIQFNKHLRNVQKGQIVFLDFQVDRSAKKSNQGLKRKKNPFLPPKDTYHRDIFT